jgi:hypothetical protein
MFQSSLAHKDERNGRACTRRATRSFWPPFREHCFMLAFILSQIYSVVKELVLYVVFCFREPNRVWASTGGSRLEDEWFVEVYVGVNA